jgi:unconventional prefoldin RPB5 interactor 1
MDRDHGEMNLTRLVLKLMFLTDKDLTDKDLTDKDLTDRKLMDRKLTDRKLMDRKLMDRKLMDLKLMDLKLMDLDLGFNLIFLQDPLLPITRNQTIRKLRTLRLSRLQIQDHLR